MPEIAIQAQHIVKRFRAANGPTTLKELVLRRRRRRTPFTALNDVSLEIQRGHTVGLIGHNGSGKSTLLKVLSGIIRPTSGTVEVNGRVASLLELGAGFNGELSARDNVYLNASLLGLTRAEIDQKYDSIVEFSELGPFMDDQVKHFSSGMYVRLGFSVAVHVDPDILLIDEVLAVGDEAFAEKCLAKIKEFQAQGRTILVVSHALDTIVEICDRAIVLDHGDLVFDGDPEFAAGTLRMLLGTTRREDDDEPEPTAEYHAVRIVSSTVHETPDGPEVTAINDGDPMLVRLTIDVDAAAAARCASVTMVLMGLGDIPVIIQTHEGGPAGADGDLRWTVDFHTPVTAPLRGGMTVAAQVSDENGAPLALYRALKAFVLVRRTVEDGLSYAPYTTTAHAVARTKEGARP